MRDAEGMHMITEYFCKGLLIGLIFGVPAGAIGALTIGRTLEKGFFAGFLTGMGSSAALQHISGTESQGKSTVG